MHQKRTSLRLVQFFVLAALLAAVIPLSPVFASPTDLFFSEYIEGSSNNKAIEIFNGTGATVDLTGYRIETYNNAATTPNYTLLLDGYSLTDGDVFVVANASAVQIILDVADVTSSITFYNGDDAVVLWKDDVVLDVIGQIGVDPGDYWGTEPITTKEHTLRRKTTIETGDNNPDDAFDPALEWDSYPQDTFDDLGAHNLTPGVETTSIYEIQGTGDASTLVGEIVTTEGIVTAVTGNGYFLQDAAGGPWSGIYVYDSSVVAVGDFVRITAEVAEYYNLTQLKSATELTILSSGTTLPAPVILASGDVSDEQWEGVLVQVQNVTVTALLGYGEWETDDGSGPVVIDDNTGYSYVPTVGDALLSITGPLNYTYDVYKILPNSDADIVSATPDYTPIYEIQGTGDASPLVDETVTTEGVVTMKLYNGYFLQDPAGGPWSGIWVYDSNTVNVGDSLRLTAVVAEYNNVTELIDVSALTVLSSGSYVPAELLATADVNNEQWEGVLVQVQNVTVTGLLDYGEWTVDDGSGNVVIDDKGDYTYAPAVSDVLLSITGPLDYSFGAYKIQPRTDADIMTPTPVNLVINEIIQNPDAVYDSVGEWFEVYNAGEGGVDLLGYTFADLDYDSFTIEMPLSIAPGQYMVFGKNDDLSTNGGVNVDYNYDGAMSLANSVDELIIYDATGAEVDRVVYDGGILWPNPTGASMMLLDPALDNSDPANWTTTDGLVYGDGDYGTPGCPNTGCAADYTTIYEIQGSADESPLVGQVVTTEGIVTAKIAGKYYIEDPAAGPWSGVYVYDTANDDLLTLGDRVRITAKVAEYNGLTELSNVSDIIIQSSGNAIPDPILIDTADIASEQWEGVLVQVENVTVTSEKNGYGEWTVDDGSGNGVIDDYAGYAHVPIVGESIERITGPVDYNYGYKIQPRSDDDIVAPEVPAVEATIYDIQGAGDISPFAGVKVQTEGIITGIFEGNTSGGDWFDGFFMQDALGDGDPTTSDGLFVNFNDLDVIVNIGDIVTVVGYVQEMSEYGDPAPETVTQLAVYSLADITVTGSGTITPVELVPDGSLAYFEALEGMLVTLSGNAYPAPVVGPTSYGTFYLVRGDEGVDRVLRNTPQDGKLFGVRNYERYGDGTENLITGSTVNAGVDGPLTYSFGGFLIAQQDIAAMDLTAVAPPAVTPSWATAAVDELTVASMNTYNFDSTGKPLTKATNAIVNLGCPTFIGLQEINVDKVMADLLVNLSTNGCDYGYGNSHADVGDHGVALLYRTDRVSSITISTEYQGCSAYGSSSSEAYDSYCDDDPDLYPLFSRRPVVANATVLVDGVSTEVIVIANHFKSKLGGVASDMRRLEQAQLVAGLVDSLVAANPDAKILVVGDLNDFEDSATVTALTASGNLSNLWFQLPAEARYSYIYNGTSQILDHILVSPSLLPRLVTFSPLHTNADFPYVPYAADVEVLWRASDHDPIASTFFFDAPVAGFTPSSTRVLAADAVNFTNTSTGDALSFSWDFGDGTSSTDVNPTKVWMVAGTYNVCLTASNDLGSDMICQAIEVRPVVFDNFDVLSSRVRWDKKDHGRNEVSISVAYSLPEGYTPADLGDAITLSFGYEGVVGEHTVTLTRNGDTWLYENYNTQPTGNFVLKGVILTWIDDNTAMLSASGWLNLPDVNVDTHPAKLDFALSMDVTNPTLASVVSGESTIVYKATRFMWDAKNK